MAQNYKTPGVYIEEISKFPPSVAAVETAIPAFIGYTQMAKRGEQDLEDVPTRITSLLEYQTYFGGPEQEGAEVRDVRPREDASRRRGDHEAHTPVRGPVLGLGR